MKKLSWGSGIAAVIIVFFIAMGIMMSIAMTHTTDLVADNYYERELNYQDRINSTRRTEHVQGAVTMLCAADTLTVCLSPKAVSAGMSGIIHFYRPSDKQKDFDVEMRLDSLRTQRIRTASMARGLWKVQVAWTAKDGEYFAEQPIVVE